MSLTTTEQLQNCYRMFIVLFSILFRILLSALAKSSRDFCMCGNRMLSILPRACRFS